MSAARLSLAELNPVIAEGKMQLASERYIHRPISKKWTGRHNASPFLTKITFDYIIPLGDLIINKIVESILKSLNSFQWGSELNLF
jgi:hypothetical protein